MTDAAAPVLPLIVHHVALTTIDATDDPDQRRFFPVIAVWAGLQPLWDSGIRFGDDLPGALAAVVTTDAALHPDNPAVMTVTVGEADDVDADPDSPDLDVPVSGPRWSFTMPSSWVAMATVVMGTPIQLRVLLVDGPPPPAPDQHVLTLGDPCVVVLPTYRSVHAPLAMVMEQEWTAPLPMQAAADHEVPPIQLMRDQMWSHAAGIALGQDRALNRMLDFAAWASQLDPGDPADQRNYADVLTAGQWCADASELEPLRRTSTGAVEWPGPMRALGAKIDEVVNDEAVDGLDSGLDFEDAVDIFGVGDTLIALAVVASARAVTMSADAPPDDVPLGRYTATYLLGTWFDEAGDMPWWATRATHYLLLHHDTDVLIDLLTCNPAAHDIDDGHSPLTFRFLHVIAEALAALGLGPQEFTERVRGLDLVPSGIEDMLYVSQQMLESLAEADRAQECVECVAVHDVISGTVDQRRLVRAAVGVLAVIADLDAALHALPVGDEEWKSHRDGYLMHWMNHTAFVAAEA